jgi:hypothetical protein
VRRCSAGGGASNPATWFTTTFARCQARKVHSAAVGRTYRRFASTEASTSTPHRYRTCQPRPESRRHVVDDLTGHRELGCRHGHGSAHRGLAQAQTHSGMIQGTCGDNRWKGGDRGGRRHGACINVGCHVICARVTWQVAVGLYGRRNDDSGTRKSGSCLGEPPLCGQPWSSGCISATRPAQRYRRRTWCSGARKQSAP